MSTIDQMNKQIDEKIVVARRFAQDGTAYHSMTAIATLGDLIERHRALINTELEGLRGDVKSAESAYEREKVRADGLAQENDRWINESLPGWRKRVSDTEGRLRDMELSRDEWKKDAATSESKLETAIAERDAYKQQRDGAEIVLSKIAALAVHPDDVVDASFAESENQCEAGPIHMDPGAPEGDVTVVAWTCSCGVKRSFTQPKLYTWTHVSNCSCGAKTVLRSDDDGRA